MPHKAVADHDRLKRAAFAASLLAAVAITGCAGKAASPATTPSPAAPPATWGYVPQTIQRIPVKQPEAFDVQRPAVLAVMVRGLNDANLDDVDGFYQHQRKEIDSMYETTAKLGGQGLLLGGYGGAQIITGVLFIAPLTMTLDVMLKNTVNTINDTLKNIDLIAETRHALIARGVPVKAPDPEAVQAILIVNKYGLVGKYGAIRGMGSEACLIVVADLVIANGTREIFRDEIHVNTSRRSNDAPPPACRPVQDFADKEGLPLRNAAHTYAQVLAAIAVHRIKEMPWKR